MHNSYLLPNIRSATIYYLLPRYTVIIHGTLRRYTAWYKAEKHKRTRRRETLERRWRAELLRQYARWKRREETFRESEDPRVRESGTDRQTDRRTETGSIQSQSVSQSVCMYVSIYIYIYISISTTLSTAPYGAKEDVGWYGPLLSSNLTRTSSNNNVSIIYIPYHTAPITGCWTHHQ